MWDLPRPGMKAMSLALAGGLLTTGPPGESHGRHYYQCASEGICDQRNGIVVVKGIKKDGIDA